MVLISVLRHENYPELSENIIPPPEVRKGKDINGENSRSNTEIKIPQLKKGEMREGMFYRKLSGNEVQSAQVYAGG